MTFASDRAVTSLYLHVPFCRGRCAYCDFYSLPLSGEAVAFWHETVKLELKRLAEEAKDRGVTTAPLETLYMGGGTPSLLSEAMLAETLEYCGDLFGFARDAEITLEANPDDLGEPSAPRAWRALGITRLSLGVQSASDRVLRLAGRRHSRADAARALRHATAAGFEHLSCDVITGLPDSTVPEVEETLAFLFAFPIDHLSSYALEVPAHTPFDRLWHQKPARFPDDETERAMNDLVRETALAHEFSHYEISNYARPGGRSRHNTVYWRALPYFGVGPAAGSYLAGVRRTNPADLAAWGARIRREGPYGSSAIDEIVDEAAARRETMLLGLRLTDGVTHACFRRRHGLDFDDVFAEPIADLTRLGLLVTDERGCRLTHKGYDFANVVFRAFV